MFRFFVISPFRTTPARMPTTPFVMIAMKPDGCSAHLMTDAEIDASVDYLKDAYATTRAECDQLEQVRIEAKQELRDLWALPPEALYVRPAKYSRQVDEK